jgi:hypothetical protein
MLYVNNDPVILSGVQRSVERRRLSQSFVADRWIRRVFNLRLFAVE